MRIDNPTKEKLKEYNTNLLKYIESNYSLFQTLYLDLGVKVVRLLCYSEEFIPLIQKQLTYTLCPESKKFDATIILWKEKNIKLVYRKIMPENLRLRVELLSVEGWHNIINSYNKETETHFYGVENLEPEEFIKEGHIFVQILNNILKTENTALVHGACIGLDNNGILLCARGQRGKSTLAVLSMTEGFEYVSDDYLTLEKYGNSLFAHPIYSIITLSPRMYNELYDRLEGCRFISNNARKDKYVINISKFHNQFKKKYPIKMCMFPEIVTDKEPSIKKCSQQEKGRAITHLVHSTIFQMNDRLDLKTVKKLINMVKDLNFYKICLCNNIHKNTKCLKDFLREYKNG